MAATVTYSHTLLIPLTRQCGALCEYCLFRSADDPLRSFDEIESAIRRHINSGIKSVVLASGQSLSALPSLREQWSAQGYASYIEFVRDVARLVIEHQLMPTLDVGPLTYAELETIRPYVVSLFLWVENTNDELLSRFQQNKPLDDLLESLNDSGLLGIPVTTGLLLGLGESIDDAMATLDAIDEIQRRHGHIQNIVLRPLVTVPVKSYSRSDWDQVLMIYNYAKRLFSDVPVTLPYREAGGWLETGLTPDDIGEVYEGYDGLIWDQTFPKLSDIEKNLHKKNFIVKPRFPIRPSYAGRLHASPELQTVLDAWNVK